MTGPDCAILMTHSGRKGKKMRFMISFQLLLLFSTSCVLGFHTPVARITRRLYSLDMKASIPILSPDSVVGGIKSTVNSINIAPITKLALSTKAILVYLGIFASTFMGKITNNVGSKFDIEKGWSKRGSSGSFKRTVEVWVFAIKFIFKWLKVKKLEKVDLIQFSAAQSELAITLRDKLLELGPTFIKLGQLLSTRVDILPKEYINALALLQDQVPGFPGEVAIQIIEKELGKPINEIYDSFDPKPLAAASLGQVHVGKLNGKSVAIKIQRTGLKELFDMDLKNIKTLAILLDKFDPKTDGAARDWGSIYDESARLLYKEINYNAEADNAIRFKNQFAGTSWIKVPEVYKNLTTERMLTMEFVPGIKINDIEAIERAGINRELLAQRSAESYLTQICRHGFFHCDPHPGNVACDNVEGGRLIYYDFGMMDELKDGVKKGLVDLIFGVYENDTKEVCNALESIEVLRKGVDRVSIEKIVRFFLSEFTQTVNSKEAKWTNQLSKDEQKEIRRARRAQLGSDLFSLSSDVPFKFPPTFTFVFRAFTSLDGIGKGLDKKYDLSRLAQPFLKELVDLRDGSATITLLKSWAKKLGWRPIDIANAIQSPRKIANVDDTIQRMEKGELKLRVRVLESERSFQRMELVQNNMALAIAASGFLNAGMAMAGRVSPSGQLTSKLFLFLAGLFGIQIPVGLIKLSQLDKKFKSFTG